MRNNKLYIIEDPVYGYKRLEPIPSEDELFEFYQSHYYSLILKGQRAPHLRRLLAGEGEKDRELSWLSSSLYMDILTILEQQNHFHPKRLLDLGCGPGDFLAFMKKSGWEVAGIELSSDAAVMARGKDLEVYNLSINDFLANYPQFLSTFGVVTLMNLLEHSPKPVEVLNIAKQLLVDNGIVLVIVPNDYS
jgi:2-polyprenyl-3-methyl-5-hydroxy-6-metoxy-1,4-benzoquinol methylase